jgi:pyridoxine 4-dehydrogenase
MIRHWGLSNVDVAQLDEAGHRPEVGMQNRYAVSYRVEGADELLRTCGERGVALVTFLPSPEPDGRWAPKTTRAKRFSPGAPAASGEDSAGLDVAARAPVLAIPGTGDPDYLTANVVAGASTLTPVEKTS